MSLEECASNRSQGELKTKSSNYRSRNYNLSAMF